jgi:hypothetical protein
MWIGENVDEIEKKGDCRNMLEAALLRAGWAGQMISMRGTHSGSSSIRLRAWMIYINFKKLGLTVAEAMAIIILSKAIPQERFGRSLLVRARCHVAWVCLRSSLSKCMLVCVLWFRSVEADMMLPRMPRRSPLRCSRRPGA